MDTVNICSDNLLKQRFSHDALPPKDRDGIAKSDDPGQTADLRVGKSGQQFKNLNQNFAINVSSKNDFERFESLFCISHENIFTPSPM